MKLSLVVGQGAHKGKIIPVTLSQFVVGRDSQCHLRPASAAVSKRHCAILIRGDKAFVRDLNSTNGTFINERQIKGEIEIQDQDKLRIGPLDFVVRLETSAAVNQPTPLPAMKDPAAVLGGAGEATQAIPPEAAAQVAAAVARAKEASGETTEDDELAALLLDSSAADPSPAPPGPLAEESVPSGSTVMELPTAPKPDEAGKEPAKPGQPAAKPAAKKSSSSDNSSKAKEILDKYMRRPRR